MEALKILKVKFPNLTFLIIGPVDKIDKKSFMQYIHDKNLKENIIHYNWKDISLFPSYVFCSDICISPLIKNAQHDSGIANKVFQYMLFEKPLIVSDCEPQSELVQEVKCGVVFRSNDINDLVEKIDYLISNPDIRHQLGQNGKIAVINKYNWNNMSRNLLNIYTEELLTI
jgi:glycosyltransferase involved in cell wall biosynthesis